LLNLVVGEWDGELDWVWHVNVYWSRVGRCPSLHATNYFLVSVVIVDVRCYYLFVGVVGAGNIYGVEAERRWVIGEVGETGVIVVFDFWLSVVVNGFLHHFDSGGCTSETLEHGDE